MTRYSYRSGLYLKRAISLSIIALMIISTFVILSPVPTRGAQPFAGPTYVYGEINTTVTWTATNSPYIIADNLTIGSNGARPVASQSRQDGARLMCRTPE